MLKAPRLHSQCTIFALTNSYTSLYECIPKGILQFLRRRSADIAIFQLRLFWMQVDPAFIAQEAPSNSLRTSDQFPQRSQFPANSVPTGRAGVAVIFAFSMIISIKPV